MKCPKCNSLQLKVTDSRQEPDKLSIRRRRECLTCNHRFTTHECITYPPIQTHSLSKKSQKIYYYHYLNSK